MSGSGSGSGNGEGANAAEAEFQRYKARLAGAAPMMVPMMMAPGMGPGWAMPPSLAPLGPVGGYPMQGAAGETAGSLAERLGTTLRLGVEFINTLLASSAGTLGSAAAMLPEARYDRGCGCGCDCGCACDCCAVMGSGCCEPRVSGCWR